MIHIDGASWRSTMPDTVLCAAMLLRPDDLESGHQGGEAPALGAIRIMTSMVTGQRIDQAWAWRACISGFLKRAPDIQCAFKALRDTCEV